MTGLASSTVRTPSPMTLRAALFPRSLRRFFQSTRAPTGQSKLSQPENCSSSTRASVTSLTRTDGALSSKQTLFTFWDALTNVSLNRVAAFLEWSLAYLLIQKNGKVYKDDVRKVLDVSCNFLFRI